MNYFICKEILERYLKKDNFIILNYKVTPIKYMETFASHYVKLETIISIKNQQERLSFLVQSTGQKGIVTNMDKFSRESFITFVLAEHCDVIFPVKTAIETKEMIVYDNPDFKYHIAPEKLNLSHIKIVLKELAKFHLTTLKLEDSQKVKLYSEYRSILQEPLFSKNEPIFSGLIRNVLQLLEGDDNLILKNRFSCYLDEFYKIMDPNCDGFTKVICHGNLRNIKIMFSYSKGLPNSCKFLDFTFMRYTPPAFDVLYFLLNALESSEFAEHYDNLLRHYYDALGVQSYSIKLREEFHPSLEKYTTAVKLALFFINLLELLTRLNLLLTEDFKRVVDKVEKEAIITQLQGILSKEIVSTKDANSIVQNKIGHSEFEVVEKILEPLNEKHGFLGEHFYLTLKIRNLSSYGDLNLKFFLKALPLMQVQRVFALNTGATFKEYSFFTKIIPAFKKENVGILCEVMPKCYLSKLNDYTVFEDLNRLGYKMVSARKSMDVAAVKMVTLTIAKMHASILIYEENQTQKLGKPYRIIDEFPEELKEAFFSEAECCKLLTESAKKGLMFQFDYFRQLLPGVDLAAFKAKAAKIHDGVYEMVKPSRKIRNTICHGDLWANNILFKMEDDKYVDCKLIDFQSYRYSSPAFDLMLFLYLATNRQFRLRYMEEIIGIYYEELKRIMKRYQISVRDVIPKVDFLKACKEAKPYCVANANLLQQCVAFTSKQLEEFFAREGCSHSFFYEDRSKVIYEMCEADPEYREILWDCTLNWKDVL